MQDANRPDMQAMGESATHGDPATLATALAALRHSFEAKHAIDPALLAELSRAIAACAAAPANHEDGNAWLALLDELELLIAGLERGTAELGGQLRAASQHRRAGVAYHGRGA